MKPKPLAQQRLLSALAASAPSRNDLYGELAEWIARLRAALSLQGALSPGEALAVRARLTPLDAQGRPREQREVRLRELSERGVAFEHPAPLADRRAVMSIDSPLFGSVSAEVNLSWCRYTEGGRYTSGGRFLQVLEDS